MRTRRFRSLGQEKEFMPMKPVPEKKSYGILGVVVVVAAIWAFLPHGILGRRR
jgi:hypothetical protein